MVKSKEKKNILIVEDNTLFAKILQEGIKKNLPNIYVEHKKNAEEAIQYISEHNLQLILLDINLPRANGLEVLRVSKQFNADTVVIMMTAYGNLNTAIESLRLGAFDYLIKPLNLKDIIKLTKKGLQYYRNLQKKHFLLKQRKKINLDGLSIEIQTIKSLLLALKAKDRQSYGHSIRVKNYAVALAREMQLSTYLIKAVKYSALLHDIGKIGLPDNLLKKISQLDQSERLKSKEHLTAGEEILSPVVVFKDVIPAIKQHHEWYDGTGYPEGLSGNDILLAARILAVADAYDAMTSDRYYHKGINIREACREIMKYAKIQFDPEVVKAFVGMINKKEMSEQDK